MKILSRFLFPSIVAALAMFGAALPLHAQSVTLPNNTTYQGHINAAPVAGPPVLTGCTVAAGSTDSDGKCTASAASGTITFANAYSVAPFCTVVDASATSTVSMPVYTVSTTVITLSTIISGHILFWHCTGLNGG